jgi:hypothetical protein
VHRIRAKQNRPTEVSLLERIFSWSGSSSDFYSFFFPDFFAAVQRLRIASAMRLRAAADIPRFFAGRAAAGADLLVLPGGRPRRFPPDIPPAEAPLMPSRACIAASSRLRSSLSCTTISSTFIDVS